MPIDTESHDPAPPPSRGWQTANEAGLSLGNRGCWPAAAEAFREALTTAPSFAEAPEVHAVLLANWAQAMFRLGDTRSAVDAARRALSARLIVCDSEHDAPMARSRADLAVYLAADGAWDEADVTLGAARHALESRYGDEDARLVTVLENQARFALAAGRPAAAEPPLLRLHALLAEMGEDPARLDPLLALVASARAGEPQPPFGEAHDGIAHAGYAPPSSSQEEADQAADADGLDLFPASAHDAFDLVDDAVHPPMRSPSAQSIRDEGLIEPGTHTTPRAVARTNPLGFEVQYGIPQEVLFDSTTPASDAPAPVDPPRPSGGGLENPFW